MDEKREINHKQVEFFLILCQRIDLTSRIKVDDSDSIRQWKELKELQCGGI